MKRTRTFPKTLPTLAFIGLLVIGLLVIGLSACGNETAAEHAEAKDAHGEQNRPGQMDMEDDHAHAAPHGGMVESAGSGHMEMVLSDGNLFIYPFDAAEQPLSVEGITDATAIIQAEGETEQTITLTPMGDHLMGTLPGGANHFTAHVSMPVEGETWTAHFSVEMNGESDHEN